LRGRGLAVPDKGAETRRIVRNEPAPDLIQGPSEPGLAGIWRSLVLLRSAILLGSLMKAFDG